MWTQTQPTLPERLQVEIVGGGGGGFWQSGLGSAVIGAAAAVVVLILGHHLQQRTQRAQQAREDRRYQEQRNLDESRWNAQLQLQARQSIRTEFVAAIAKILRLVEIENEHYKWHFRQSEAAYTARIQGKPQPDAPPTPEPPRAPKEEFAITIDEVRLLSSNEFNGRLLAIQKIVTDIEKAAIIQQAQHSSIERYHEIAYEWSLALLLIHQRARDSIHSAARVEMGVASPEDFELPDLKGTKIEYKPEQ